MKNFMIICLMGFFLLATACKTTHKEVIVTKSGEIIVSPEGSIFDINPNSFFGTYIGLRPCSCCAEGVKSVLTLKGDSSYLLKEDRKHKSKVTSGYYSIENNIITLDDNLAFRINGNQLYYLSPENSNKSKDAPTFILNKIK
ncbi:copper resistance protein NlpE N-terminal domain-containing protein [Ornithobacterium rhinotracheale]|nr:copper resistance protein NlpE N-terminal domain-containing protein [Ornithobacterium rhinotracheale]AIQ00559.1 hypothetical protein Q785_06925 [Ornithobacterium rhinotracheale ORT-UMN 88]UOH65821.1 copper resistance protein NlpE [Ornithobacterium rhinotracheale]